MKRFPGIQFLIIYILLSSFFAYAVEKTIVKEQMPVSIIDMTDIHKDDIVKNALLCSLAAERAAKYYLYEGYQIDTIQTRIEKSKAIAFVELGIKKLTLSLMKSRYISRLSFIEDSYDELKILEKSPYNKDSMILVQDLTMIISKNMRDIANHYYVDQPYNEEIEKYKVVINIEESTRLYMIYQKNKIKYNYTDEILNDVIIVLRNQFENIDKKERYTEERYREIGQTWTNIEEIYADRDEGNLMLEAIEATEYLEKYLL